MIRHWLFFDCVVHAQAVRSFVLKLRSECHVPMRNRMQAGKPSLDLTRAVLSNSCKALLATILYGFITASLSTNTAPEGRQRPYLQVSQFCILVNVEVMLYFHFPASSMIKQLINHNFAGLLLSFVQWSQGGCTLIRNSRKYPFYGESENPANFTNSNDFLESSVLHVRHYSRLESFVSRYIPHS